MHKNVAFVEYITNGSGDLSVLEFSKLPWDPKRIYWLSNLDSLNARGNHAHKSLSQLFIMVSGSLTMDIYYGEVKQSLLMDSKNTQILLYPGYWRVIRDASPDAVLLVLADQIYNEEDYIRDWNQYLEWFGEGKHDI